MIEANRRQFLGTATAVFAQPRSAAIKAVAFDALAIFDPRPVFHLAEELLPGRGAELSNQWRTRQFEYTWLRNSMHRYVDFWRVTQDALNYAAKQSHVTLNPEQSLKLMSAYLKLRPWPDVAAVIETLRKRGFRLALLSNWTPSMLQACLKTSGLEGVFEFQLSTDRVKVFKPDPATYQMGLAAFHLEKRELAFVAFGGWDAAGARAFGYPTYWVNRLDLPPEELSVSTGKTYHDLSFLPTFLDSLRI